MIPQTQRIKNLTDEQWEPLFDAVVFPAAVAVQTDVKRMFSVPLGNPMYVGGPSKTLADTNMRVAGQLPTPEVFRMYGIKAECFIEGAADAEFLQNLLKYASVNFKVGSKPYLTVPFQEIAGKVETFALGLDQTVATASHGLVKLQTGKSVSHGFRFPPEFFIDIASTENFAVEITLNFPAPFTPAQDIYMRIYLMGIRGKDVR